MTKAELQQAVEDAAREVELARRELLLIDLDPIVWLSSEDLRAMAAHSAANDRLVAARKALAEFEA
jgi:hypothetical protein